MKKILSLFAAVLFAGSMFAVTYNAVKVTSVKAGGLYMFERNNRVLIGSTGSGTTHKLQTTGDYGKAGLVGDEQYIWQLKTVYQDLEETIPTDSFRILNVLNMKNATGHIGINNPSKKTDITLSDPDSSTPWKITFDGEVATLYTRNMGYTGESQNRFLGEVSSGSNDYRSYAVANLTNYGHDFTVYELQETTDPYLTTDVAAVNFGTVVKDALVAAKEVTVNFGNLTGAVTYSGLSTPFTASGTIAASGDKITIAASAAATGDFSQTLTITSAADSKSATVTVTMKVIEGSAGGDTYGLYKEALVEGDYVICYNEKALDTLAVGSSSEPNARLGYLEVTPENNIISDPNVSIIWHIAKSGDYWTLYNAKADKYAAAKTAKNKAQMLADGTDDKALWILTESDGTYEFENKSRAAGSDPNNKWLRNNGTSGFACYATNIGGALSLYKKGYTPVPTAVDNIEVAEQAMKIMVDGQLYIIRDGKTYTITGAEVR